MLDALATAPSSGGGSNYTFFLLIALAIGAMWLMTSRTRKQQKQAASARNSLVPGDEVMTASGLFGTVVDAEGDTVTLETSPGVHTRWVRAAILKKVDKPAPTDEEEAGTDGEPADDVDEFEVPDDLSGLDEPGGSSSRTRTDDPEK